MQHNNNPFTHQQKSHSEIAISHENFTIEFLEISQDVIKKIKSFIETKKIDKPYWEINNYNPKIIEASKMCDILLEYDTITIEILENLSDNYKRCVADMFL